MPRLAMLALAFVLLPLAVSRAEEPPVTPIAKRIDALLTQGKNVPLPGRTTDEVFLRRITLDLTGQIPTPTDLKAFLADSNPQKREKLIDRLLASEVYAINWARYWRDVVTYHTPASGNYLRWDLFNRWWIDQVRDNRPWSTIVTSLLTATGINDEVAPVNYLTSHFGNPVEIAATTSRVFLGVQLQCAECHDAKTEPWKREQFHELVAFFGRARIIQHKDVYEKGRGTPYAIDGRADGQYQMVDRKDPNKLYDMTPRFLSGETVSANAPDLERRTALAKFITSNERFARAYVNRIWTSLLGWGFYPSVADLGSHDIEPRYPEVLDVLAKEFVSSGHDMKHMLRVIVNTEAYQRQLQPRSDADLPTPACCPNRLRPEQVFEAMVKALDFDEKNKSIPAPAPSSAPAIQRHTGLRNMIYMAFRTDPSLPAEEVQGTIPQALLMMNSVLVNTYIATTGKTFLADCLKKEMANDQIVLALYERTLSRRPRTQELAVCQQYLRRVPDRQEALEDIFWSLINSTEFLTKR